MLLRDERGSVLPLMIAYAVLAIALIVVSASATSLHLAQKRLDAIADAAALAGADGFTLVVEGEEATARLDDASVRAQAAAVVAAMPGDPILVAAGTPDGVSARVTVSLTWRAPLVSAFVPSGVALQASATSRTTLQ
ncbi:hypothetical protein QWJ90_06915 [Microbacterium oryzae]|nr:pilus assembly protein TadG-related protein [Microbacterium oryzae]MDN3310656.1 hypothetical protein [Microbacterium oryzae]